MRKEVETITRQEGGRVGWKSILVSSGDPESGLVSST